MLYIFLYIIYYIHLFYIFLYIMFYIFYHKGAYVVYLPTQSTLRRLWHSKKSDIIEAKKGKGRYGYG